MSARIVSSSGSSPRRRLAAAAAVALAVAAAAGACAGDGSGSGVLAPHTPVIGTNGGGGNGTSGTSSADAAALVGQWFRLVYFTDSIVGVQTSETTWEFRGDGTATRSVVARTLSNGFSSGVVTNATWSLSGATLSVNLLPVGTGSGGTNAGGLPPVTGNPPFGTPTDSTRSTTVTFAMRIDSTSTPGSRTLFLDEQPYIFLGPPLGTTSR